MPYIVALSGGIASGKSTVANLFADLGVPIIDADIIARQVVAKNSPALNQIQFHFGNEVITPDGELDRTRLRKIVFNNEQERLWLNNLLHPLIAEQTQQQIMQYNQPYVIWVVPLLIENKLHLKADRVLIVDTTEEVQLQRLQKRDNISPELAQKMLLSQIDNKQRRAYADDIITNNDNNIALEPQVLRLHNQYLKLSALKKSV